MRMGDVETGGEPTVGPFDRPVEPAVDRLRLDLAHDRRLAALPFGPQPQGLPRRHQENLAQPLIAMRPPMLGIAAAHPLGPGGQAHVEPIMALAPENAVGRPRQVEPHDPRLRLRHRNLGLENRPGIGFRHRSPALWPCLALSLHYGSFSIVWSIASAPESPPSLGHQASRQRCGTLWREMDG